MLCSVDLGKNVRLKVVILHFHHKKRLLEHSLLLVVLIGLIHCGVVFFDINIMLIVLKENTRSRYSRQYEIGRSFVGIPSL